MTNAHPAVRLYACNFCRRAFVSEKALMGHRGECHEFEAHAAQWERQQQRKEKKKPIDGGGEDEEEEEESSDEEEEEV